MYISRLTLNTQNRAARKDLSNPYDLHRTLKSIFSQGHHPLYRVEEHQVLVQSTVEPDWTSLPRDYLIQPAESRCLNLDVLADHLQPLRFRLRANPTQAKLCGHRERDGKRKTKRHALFGLEEQLDWLKRQGNRCGFQIVGAMVSDCGYLRGFRPEGGTFHVYQATYDGHLRVSERPAFRTALERGVGHGKAWGLGLLSVPHA